MAGPDKENRSQALERNNTHGQTRQVSFRPRRLGAGLRLRCGLGFLCDAGKYLPAPGRAAGVRPGSRSRCGGHADHRRQLSFPHEPVSGCRRYLYLYEEEFRLRSRLPQRLVPHPDLCGHHLGQCHRPAPHRPHPPGQCFPVRLSLRDRRLSCLHGRNDPGSGCPDPRRAGLPAAQSRGMDADRHGRAALCRRRHLLRLCRGPHKSDRALCPGLFPAADAPGRNLHCLRPGPLGLCGV